MKEKVIVSACLIGKNCKYNGLNNENQKIINFLLDKEIVPVCPEVMGGLSVPRLKSEIDFNDKNKVINEVGNDVTFYFEKGAQKAMEIVLKSGASLAIVKEKSPSCGKNKIYNGKFNGELIDGSGVFTKLLKEKGIKVLTEEDFV